MFNHDGLIWRSRLQVEARIVALYSINLNM